MSTLKKWNFKVLGIKYVVGGLNLCHLQKESAQSNHPVVARYKMKPNLFLTKSLGFLWSSGFSGHFKLLIKVDGNILGWSLGH